METSTKVKYRSAMRALSATCATYVVASTISIAPAWGQESGTSSVTLYGSIDQGIEFLNRQQVGKTSTSGLRIGSGTATSYFGFRGVEDLGGGLSTIWNLEGGFSPNAGTSSQGGRLFGRQSYVGLSGHFGRVTIGRQYTMRFFATQMVNPFGTGAQGLTTLDNGIANARADNSISYRFNLGDLEGGVNWSFGRDAVNGNSAPATNCPGNGGWSKECREWSGMLKYDRRSWGLATAYERQYGGTAATWGGLTNPNLTDSRIILGGYVRISKAKVGVGWIRRDDQGIATPKSNLMWVTATVPITPSVSFDSMLAQLRYDHSPNKATVVVLRGTYAFSKRTIVYITADHINNAGQLALAATTLMPVVTPSAGGAQLSVIAGVRHRF
ncbi:porin [Robbsia sp. KACC 23696]|uniref:porin n=1 Tax=Robbsia sp. KACC 23696 TaxID=3149231 RepID=UPI00325A80BD